MNPELPPTDIDSEKSIPKQEETAVPVATSPATDEGRPYLSFDEEEKDKILRDISAVYAARGHDVNNNPISFPEGEEEIEDFISGHRRYFTTERLVEVALNNSEYAPKLVSEIARRRDFGQLERVLHHYKKDTPRFEFCVKQIESALQDNELGNNILMALSASLAKAEAQKEPETIAEHKEAMKKEKATARPLKEYQRLLKISDEELKVLSDQELLLIGGGFSPIKAELTQAGIGCKITNIDPIVEPDPRIADEFIKRDFFGVVLEENKYTTEIALHSLPTYAFSPQQVTEFYSRSILSLKQGGLLHVMPVNGFADYFTPAMRLSRKPVNDASVKFVQRLKQRPDLFAVTEFTVEAKDYFGRKTQRPGVKIGLVGDRDQVREFLGVYKAA